MLKNGSEINLTYIEDWATSNHVSLARAASELKSPLISKSALWNEIKDIKFDFDDHYAAKIVTDEYSNILTELSGQIAGAVQFPINTIFMHGLGCVSSAMTKSFVLNYHDFEMIPCNLYIVTAQPPSTGKSTINSRLYNPVRKALKELNESTRVERDLLKREIAKLLKELDKDKSKEGFEEEILDKIKTKQDRLAEIPHWDGALTDTTIEAAELVASQQQGVFNIVSAEAESVNVIVGAVYADTSGGRKANQGLVLEAWDGGHVNTKRISRDGFDGAVKATISVIAQDDTIDTILAAGASGRGLTERFLLLNEKPLLGHRDHFKPYSFDKSLYRRYESLIYNIVMEGRVELRLHPDADEDLMFFKAQLEPDMREEGCYSNALLTGLVGKADKQVRKIASVLHVIEHWQDGADRSNVISKESMLWAISLFRELSKTFISASDRMGYVGEFSEIDKVRQVVTDSAEKGKTKINFTSLRDKIKNVRPFKGSRNLSKKLREDVLPVLEKHNYIVVSDNNIYINPRLK